MVLLQVLKEHQKDGESLVLQREFKNLLLSLPLCCGRVSLGLSTILVKKTFTAVLIWMICDIIIGECAGIEI